MGKVLRERYEIIAELGKGGMSTVYLAKDKNLGSYWAVKRVKNNQNVDIESFKKEVELLTTLNHADIPRIVERIDIQDGFFVIMDFIDGTSLGKKVLEEGPQPEKEVIEWAKMLCDVLDYLHTANVYPIIYRDMKPDNVMLTQAGRVKLIDFGIAKECKPGEKQTGATIGTRGYAAPEQYKNSTNILDERTDIYSLGATLFFLVTGVIPGKPPNALRPIRQVNPILSEGLEYIISKSTKNNPQLRYQNCKELKNDLNKIEQLTSAFRNKMRKKLSSFILSFVACVLCIILSFVGYLGLQKEKEDYYQYYYKLATNAERMDDYINAAVNYAKAIQYKPSSVDTYLLYFNSLLLQDSDEEPFVKIKEAIDTMRYTYLDNKYSAMYQNSDLLFKVAQKCLEVNDANYAAYAVEYFEILKKINYNKQNFDSYAIIASNCAKNLETQNFEVFNDELLKLETSTDNMKMNSNERLDNYYTIIFMYSTYPTYLEDSYKHIVEVGSKAKEIIDMNLQSEEITFTNIIPMYEMIASAAYSNGIILTDQTQKEEWYKLSIEWFGYLDNLNANLSEALWIKKACGYKEIFEIQLAIKEFLDIINKYNNSFLAHVYITHAYLDREIIKTNISTQDFSTVKAYYAKVVQMKENNKNLSSIALSRFSSLKKAISNAGLEG